VGESEREREEERREQEAKLSEELQRTGKMQPRDVTPVEQQQQQSPALPKRSSKVGTGDEKERAEEAAPDDAAVPSAVEKNQTAAEPPTSEQGPSTKHDAARHSTQSTSSLHAASPGGEGVEGVKRLSITIPGSSGSP
jgi:hypothetical protein